MSVEQAPVWITRCDKCGHVYGDNHYSEEEALAEDHDGRGLCYECVASAPRQPAEGHAAAGGPSHRKQVTGR